jgi:leucyl-tRNA synthetase
MVCHETFRDKNGDWLLPSEVAKGKDKKYIHIKTNEEVFLGKSEKMSKSKKNIVEPGKIIEKYGTDTARLFMLSDSPVDKNLQWNDSGVDGCYKYINRLFKLVNNSKNLENYKEDEFYDKKNIVKLGIDQQNLIKITHKTIKFTQDNLEKMSYNIVIAKIRELSNVLEKFTVKSDLDERIKNFSLNKLVLLLYPITPHICEELWQILGNKNVIADDVKFPEFNPDLVLSEELKIAVQINGKLKTVINFDVNSSKEDIESKVLEDDNIKKNIINREIKKIIFVPGKLVNIVI